MPFIAHAFSTPADLEHQWIDSEDKGLVITNPHGKIISASSSGHHLLALASSNHPWTPANHGQAPEPPALLQILCKRLASVRAGCRDSKAPNGSLQNAWGRFVFRAYWLQPHGNFADTIGISIRRQELMPLKLVRRIKHLPLSGKQAEVCLLMATGHSYNQIAERQGMKRNTAISHGREIYSRLGVHNREQLVAQILTPTDFSAP